MTTLTSDNVRAPEALSVSSVLSQGRYIIPLYQRAYAWTRTEVETLLKDVRDARIRSEDRSAFDEAADYYIGSLVVNTVRADGEIVHEVVDGQQRLTTLTIILAVAARCLSPDALPVEATRSVLGFAGRPDAEEDLRLLATEGVAASDRLRTAGIRDAAETVDRACRASADAPGTDDTLTFTPEDLRYLQDNVRILRTSLPLGTDLNHYFEVMNTRGEQLEKHEVLKARMARQLPLSDQATFADIWDACSVLDRHLQIQFSPGKPHATSERSRLFGPTWDTWVITDADTLFATLAPSHDGSGGIDRDAERVESPSLAATSAARGPSLIDVLGTAWSGREARGGDPSDEETGSYGTIIDFPNLLLHVLKLFRSGHSASMALAARTNAVSLMDKNLLAEFDEAGPRGEAEVRDFAWLLLKTRYLLDTYVIRTLVTAGRDHEENWVLHRFRRADGKLGAGSTFGASAGAGGDLTTQRQVLLLQSMFQVTDTRRTGKNFLFDMLSWLHAHPHGTAIDGGRFAAHLESMARDRLTAIIAAEGPGALHRGTQVQNFVFNYLDYELFRCADRRRRAPSSGLSARLFGNFATTDLDAAVKDFRFRFRSSVEHFYPVNPDQNEGHSPLPSEVRDHFGNLCLMTRSENSSRNNLIPSAKVTQFKSSRQTLKFQIMAAVMQNGTGQVGWGEAEIRAHGADMIEVLEEALAARTE